MNENEETDEETDEEQASCNRAAEAAANDESWSGSEEPEETAYIGEKQMVKIVVRKADGSEVEAEVPVLNAGVIRLDGELYSLDRMTTDRAMSSGKRTAYFVPAEASFLEDVGIDAIVYLDPKGEFDPDGIISCELREAMKGWILEL